MISEHADCPTLPTGRMRVGRRADRLPGGFRSARATTLDRALHAPGPLPQRGGFVFVSGPRARFQTAAGPLERAASTGIVSLATARLPREHVKSPPAARHRVLCPAWPDRLLSPATAKSGTRNGILTRANLFVLLLREEEAREAGRRVSQTGQFNRSERQRPGSPSR
jgi:hypothetical protein